MATQEKTWNVANRLHSLKDSDNPEVNHIIAGADEIYDDEKGAKQSDINAQADAALADRYTKAETYSKDQLDALITTPDVNYVTVATFADLPQTGEANTIYRVSSYDGTQADASKYALYAWNGTSYQLLAVRSAIGEVFDVSEYNSGDTYETLTAALAAVPASVQRGGMSIKFILRTNTGTEEEPVYHDEYVQYRLMNTAWSNVVSDWQGVDKELTSGSRNLVESGVVQNELALGAVYDVSAKNPTAGPNNDGKFESLSALLSDANINTLIPTAVRRPGMSLKFAQSSDNKYIQARCMAQNFTTDVTQWQGVDDEPTAGSNNLVKSGGVYGITKKTKDVLLAIDENDLVVGHYYNISTGEKTANSNTKSVLMNIPNNTKVLYAAMGIGGTTNYYGIVIYDAPVESLTDENLAEHRVIGITAGKIALILTRIEVESNYKSIAISSNKTAFVTALLYGIDFSIGKKQSRVIDTFFLNNYSSHSFVGKEIFLKDINKTSGLVCFRCPSLSANYVYNSTVKKGKELILFTQAGNYLVFGAVIDWDVVGDDVSNDTQRADNTYILSCPKSCIGQSFFDMFFNGKYRENGSVVYNVDGVVQQFNCLWEDGTQGVVVYNLYDANVLEYRGLNVTYGSLYTIKYGTKTFDENGNTISVDGIEININN